MNQIVKIPQLPVGLQRHAVLIELVVGVIVHLHGINRHGRHPNPIVHPFVAFLIESVCTNPNQIFREVLCFYEGARFGSLPFRHGHEEIVVTGRGHVLESGIEVEVVVIKRHPRLQIFGEVVGDIKTRVFRREVRVFHLSERRVEVSRLFMGSRDPVFPSFVGAENRARKGSAGIARRHARGDLALHGTLSPFLRDDVDGAADCIGSVQNGGRPLDDFNAFDHGGIDQNRRAGHGLVFGDALSVDHHDGTEGIFASDLNALHALTAVVHDADAGNVFENVPDGLGVRPFDFLFRHDGDRHRHVQEFLFDAGCRHSNFFRAERFLGLRRNRHGQKGKRNGPGAFINLKFHRLLWFCQWLKIIGSRGLVS